VADTAGAAVSAFTASAGAPVVAPAGAGGAGVGLAGAAAAAAPVVLGAAFVVGAGITLKNMWKGFRNNAGMIEFDGVAYDTSNESGMRSYTEALLAKNPTLTRLAQEDGPIGSRHRQASTVPTEDLEQIFRGLETRRRGSDPRQFGTSMFGAEWMRASAELERRGLDPEAIRKDIYRIAAEKRARANPTMGPQPPFDPEDTTSFLGALEASGGVSGDRLRSGGGRVARPQDQAEYRVAGRESGEFDDVENYSDQERQSTVLWT